MTLPNSDDVRKQLERHVKGAREKAYDDGTFQEPLLGASLVDDFDEWLMAWSVDPLPEDAWKEDWAGKEILQLVRQILASRFSPPVASSNSRIDTVDWFTVGHEIVGPKKSVLQEQKRGALDRDIERAIQPSLVRHLWAHVEADATASMNADFAAIATCLTD